jgi:hypothetical protein
MVPYGAASKVTRLDSPGGRDKSNIVVLNPRPPSHYFEQQSSGVTWQFQ